MKNGIKRNGTVTTDPRKLQLRTATIRVLTKTELTVVNGASGTEQSKEPGPCRTTE